MVNGVKAWQSHIGNNPTKDTLKCLCHVGLPRPHCVESSALSERRHGRQGTRLL